MTNSSRPPLWLRDEPKAGERRAALTPAAVATLRRAGFDVTVEHSPARAFDMADYLAAGARPADAGAWRSASPDTVIIGLKELAAALGPFSHRHVHFAHVFKRQQGWADVLRAFDAGGGQLFDLEYLVDDEGRRIAAFGYWAGYVGAALGVLSMAADRHDGRPLSGPLQAFADRRSLLSDVRAAVQALATAGRAGTYPRALVTGALGRSGRGAVDLLRAAGIDPVCWDRDETASGGPFAAVLEHELLVNCVFVAEPVAPFTTRQHLAQPGRRTRVIVDVSCDPFGEANVLPIYTRPTTLEQPVVRLIDALPDDGAVALDLVGIDHLPALLPRESSEDFCAQLLPALLALRSGDDLARGPFGRAAEVFVRESAAALSQPAHAGNDNPT